MEKCSYVIPILDGKGKKRNITFALLDVLYEKLDPKFKELSPYEQMGRGASMIEITLLVIRPDEVKYVEQFLNEFQNKEK